MQTIIFDSVALRCNEIPSPVDFYYEFVNANDFHLRGNFRVEILFSGAENWKSTP